MPCASTGSTAGCSTTSRGATRWPAGSSTWTAASRAPAASSTSSPPRGRRQAGPLDRVRRPRPPPGREVGLPPLAGARGRGRVDWSPGRSKVAMEYSPRNANPYISRVDAGTVELVRSFGVEVVPSGDLVQRFEATWDDEQWAMHQEAARVCRAAYDVAFGLIAERVRRDGSVMETEVQRAILDHFAGQRPDHRRPADRRRRPAQRRPPLRDHPRDRRPDPARATSSWSTSGPRSTGPGPSTPTTPGSASSARPSPSEYEDLFRVVVRGPGRRDRAGQGGLRRRPAAPGREVDDAARRGHRGRPATATTSTTGPATTSARTTTATAPTSTTSRPATTG